MKDEDSSQKLREIRKSKSDGGPKQSRHRKFHIKIEPENSTDTYVTFFDVNHFEGFPASKWVTKRRLEPGEIIAM